MCWLFHSLWFGSTHGGVLSTWLSVAGGQPRWCDVGGVTQGKLARSHFILFLFQKKLCGDALSRDVVPAVLAVAGVGEA